MSRISGPLILIGLVIMCFGCTFPGHSSYMLTQKAPPPDVPASGNALIYFMRPAGYGYGIHFPIYHEKDLIGLSQAKSYFTYECKPGRHRFLGMAENKFGLKAELGPDKTYFVLTKAHTGKTKARIEIIPVTPGSQWWDLVDSYKESLIHTIADPAALQSWMAGHRGQAETQLSVIYSFLDTAEGQQYVVYMRADDGR